MASLTPATPVQADHRFIHKVVSTHIGSGKVEFRPSEFDRISRVFARMGGSWERLFRGSVKDVGLIKRLVKLAYKHGYLTRKEKW